MMEMIANILVVVILHMFATFKCIKPILLTPETYITILNKARGKRLY